MLTPNVATALIVVCCVFAAFGIIGFGASFIKPQTASELDTQEHAWWRTATVLGGTAPRRKRRIVADTSSLEMRTDSRMVVGTDGRHRYVEGGQLVTDDIMTAGVVNASALELASPHKDAYVTGVNVIPAVLLPHWDKTCVCDDCTTARFVSNNLDRKTGEWAGATEAWSPFDQLSGVGDFITDAATVIEGVIVEDVPSSVPALAPVRIHTAQELEDMRWRAEFARVDDILEDTLRGIERRLRKQFPGIDRDFAAVDAKYRAAQATADAFVVALTTATAEYRMVSA